jgi:hypothetical protein
MTNISEEQREYNSKEIQILSYALIIIYMSCKKLKRYAPVPVKAGLSLYST